MSKEMEVMKVMSWEEFKESLTWDAIVARNEAIAADVKARHEAFMRKVQAPGAAEPSDPAMVEAMYDQYVDYTRNYRGCVRRPEQYCQCARSCAPPYMFQMARGELLPQQEPAGTARIVLAPQHQQASAQPRMIFVTERPQQYPGEVVMAQQHPGAMVMAQQHPGAMVMAQQQPGAVVMAQQPSYQPFSASRYI